MADSISLSSVLLPPTPVGPSNAALAAKDAADQSSNPLSALPALKQVGPTNVALAAQHTVKPHGDEIVQSTTTAKTAESHDIRNAATQHGLTSGDHHGSSTGHAAAINAGGLAVPLSGGLAVPLSRGALAGAAELGAGTAGFSAAAGFGPVAGAALLVGTQSAPPVSREQATAIGTAENAKYGGKTSEHVFSPYSNLQADQARPTQTQQDSRALAPNELAPQPRAGVAPTTHGGVAADHPAAGTMLEARRSAQTLAPSMPAGVTVQTVNCDKPPKPEYEATRKQFDGTPKNRYQDGAKADFIKHVATNDPGELIKLGFSDSQIKTMATEGKVPKEGPLKVEVHHRMPLECGGTNDFDNLTLVREDMHRPLTEAQRAGTQGLKPGESLQVNLLMTEKGTMYPSLPDAVKLPKLNIP